MSRVLLVLMCLALAFSANGADSTVTNQQSYEVKGVVVGLDPDGKSVTIRHEAVPGYMGAMTMSFVAKDTNELAGLAVGDSVAFRMTVTENDGWIDQIKKVPALAVNLPANSPFHIVRDVDILKEGDVLPDYHFINEQGQPIHLWQYQGQALALNFVFTRCPFPTYCPLMANNFAAAQKSLLSLTNAPANWHLLTISFDPDHDTPEVLRGYAIAHQYDPARWTFATGAVSDIHSLGDQLDLQFWTDPDGTVTHNLRTVVIDATGRIQKIYVGNQWTPDELVVEMIKAAAVK